MKKWLLGLALLASGSMLLSGCNFAEESDQDNVSFDGEGKLTAPFDEGITEKQFNAIDKATDHLLVKPKNENLLPGTETLGKFGITKMTKLSPMSDWYLAYSSENADIVKLAHDLRKEGCFELVDFDYIGQGGGFAFADGASNPYAETSSFFETANVTKAWEYMKEKGVAGGDHSVTVAVIDTGVDYNHEDLKANMWTNLNEIPGNGIDDDGDGYVDDVYGANTLDEVYDADAGDPMDDHGHGTHVAGIIAGVNNTKGSLGVAYNCKIMAIKAGNASGYFTNSSIAKAVLYAYEHGADVINMSFGSAGVSFAVQEALSKAYERCVLVAAAGNDGVPNENAPEYPAAFPFVVGVMSESNLNVESSFTNYDVKLGNQKEYEVYAPGEGIFSTLPGNRYAKWNGTSMAAPVVSGAAALLRSLHMDRTLFPTKAIMARLCSSNGRAVTCTNPSLHGPHNLPCGLDVYNSLVHEPAPDVSLYDHTIFDNIGENDDDDGVIDAGETINIGVTLKNRGGVAKDVKVEINTLSEAGVEDRYVKTTIGSISMKDIGTYSLQDCGEIKDESSGKVTGVETPLQIQIAENCPNDYLRDINVKMSWKNGLDETDETVYTKSDTFQINVQKGILLPKLISEDTTLSKGSYYILNSSMVIEEDATLTIEPGVTIQWYASSTKKYQYSYAKMSLINKGKVVAKGTESDRITFKPSELFPDYPVCFTYSNVELEYCNFVNLRMWGDTSGSGVIRNCSFTMQHDYQGIDDSYVIKTSEFQSDGGIYELSVGTIENCSFTDCDYNRFDVKDVISGCSFYNCLMGGYYGIIIYDKCIGNYFYNDFSETKREKFNITLSYPNSFIEVDSRGDFKNNVFSFANPNNLSIRLNTNQKYRNSISVSTNTFFGVDSNDLDAIFLDYFDDGESGILDYSNGWNGADYSAATPIILDAYFENADGERQDPVGAGTYKCVVVASRNMDTTIPLKVSFGSTDPYADYIVKGSWKEGSKTIWEGTYSFDSKYEGGTNHFSIYNGRADDNHSLQLIRDSRLTFKIDVSSAQAMSLQASATSNGVQLTWFQDDYPTIAGYNLYKSTAKDGQYIKVNKSLVAYDVTEYLDQEVEPGVTYYYNFTVVLSDMSESKPSGKTSVTTYDSLAPDVYHTPVSTAYLGFNLMVSATVTDNVGAQSVTLRYRIKGEEAFQEVAMIGNNSKYTGMIPASSITAAGLEYYIDAFDGANHTYSGTKENPHQVIVQSKVTENEKGDVDANGVIDLYDALLVIRAANDLENLTTDEFNRADLNGDGHLTAYEAMLILQFANGTITSFKEYL